MDFGQLYMGEQDPRLQIRIVTSPFYAKRLMGVLQEAISQYEQSYGKILDEADQKEPGAGRGKAGGADRRCRPVKTRDDGINGPSEVQDQVLSRPDAVCLNKTGR